MGQAFYGGKGNLYSDPRDEADDIARERLDRIRAERRGERFKPAPEMQPYRSWADKLLDFFR
jgi:hypothetical protein